MQTALRDWEKRTFKYEATIWQGVKKRRVEGVLVASSARAVSMHLQKVYGVDVSCYSVWEQLLDGKELRCCTDYELDKEHFFPAMGKAMPMVATTAQAAQRDTYHVTKPVIINPFDNKKGFVESKT